MLTKYAAFFLLGVCGGIIIIIALSHTSPVYNLMFRGQHARILQETPQATPNNLWEKIAAEASFSTAALQSFQGGKLVRSGSGIVLSADGLIVSTSDVLPAGPFVYQAIFDDRVFSGKVVARDYGANLALLKIDAAGLTVSRLDRSDRIESGRDMVLTGKIVTLSRPAVFTQKALLNYRSGDTFVLDTAPNAFISGGKVVTAEGHMIGLAYIRSGKAHMVPASHIDEFLKRTLGNP